MKRDEWICAAKRRQPVTLTALGLALVLFFVAAPKLGLAKRLELMRKIPHSGYSEGLDYSEGYLWNAFPKYLLKIDPKDGSVVARFLPGSEYSESVAWFKGKLWNLSYSDNGIYTGEVKKDAISWKRAGTAPEEHAWGLTHDGKSLIMTGNYSNKVYFVDPKTVKVTRTITAPIKDLEDLAWDGVGLWASSFTETRGVIFRIDPQTGMTSSLFELASPEECPVIDGIAWDGKGLWVTGKECPSIFYFKKPPESELKMTNNKKPAPPSEGAGTTTVPNQK